MKKRFLASVVAVAAVGATVVAAPASASSPPTGERSLATVLAADGNRFDRNWNDFDILDKAVTTVLTAKPDSPVKVLADGSQPLTAFLPTDRAFRRLVTDLTGMRPRTERGRSTSWPQRWRGHDRDGAALPRRPRRHDHLQAGPAPTAPPWTAAGPPSRLTCSQRVDHVAGPGLNDANAWSSSSAKNINKGNRQIGHGITQVLRPANL